jgi:hypothetical protein
MLNIAPRRLGPRAVDYFLTAEERLDAPQVLMTDEAVLLQTFRELATADRCRVLAVALAASVKAA